MNGMNEERLGKLVPRLRDMFESTIDSDFKYDGSFKDVDCSSILYKAKEKELTTDVGKFNVSMANCLYESKESVLIVFSMQVEAKIGVKYVSDKVMEIIHLLETAFINLDSIQTNEESSEDTKCVNIIVIKHIE